MNTQYYWRDIYLLLSLTFHHVAAPGGAAPTLTGPGLRPAAAAHREQDVVLVLGPSCPSCSSCVRVDVVQVEVLDPAHLHLPFVAGRRPRLRPGSAAVLGTLAHGK